MAQKTKVFAPEGYHFMVKKNGSFYLMLGAYTPHTLSNGDKSSEYVMIQYLTEHPVVSTTSTSPRTARVGTTTTRRASTTTTPTRSTTTTSSSGSSSGGGYSGGY
tara:strand:+ start:911 stop:1225 length:315 start_codon:yes stop_codon:yes gene_type:complete